MTSRSAFLQVRIATLRDLRVEEEVRWAHSSAANVDPDHDLQTEAVESIRRIKALKPEVVYFSHCPQLDPTHSGPCACGGDVVDRTSTSRTSRT